MNTYNDAFGYMDVTDDELGITKEVKTIVDADYDYEFEALQNIDKEKKVTKQEKTF